MTECGRIRIGTAGWSIPKAHATAFPAQGTHLRRYAQRFTAVEINTSFYRPHKPETYLKWAASVPPGFRFAVKIPQEITHTSRLTAIHEPLIAFLHQTSQLGSLLGPILVQLPPSLQFDCIVAKQFFDTLRKHFSGQVVCESRHPSWFTNVVDTLLQQNHVARAVADPAPVPRSAMPGGYDKIIYRRLHGSPRMYYSAYPPEYLDLLAGEIRQSAGRGQDNWCIFDNTARGEATGNAIGLLQRLGRL